MNRTYKTVFNCSLGVWQAVAEIARGRGKRKSALAPLVGAGRIAALSLTAALGLASAPVGAVDFVYDGSAANPNPGAGAVIDVYSGDSASFMDSVPPGSTGDAGSATINNNGDIYFNDTSTAGNATITNAANGWTRFWGASSAGTATITNEGVNGTWFDFNATAGNATITNNNAGLMVFAGNSTAGSATLTNNNIAWTSFFDNSTPGNARLINAAGATGGFDFSATSGPGGNGQLSAGSIEGGGFFRLGGNQFTVGGNGATTTVSGAITDGSAGGSLVKTGIGTMTLTGANSWTGTTTVDGGTLEIAGGGSVSNAKGYIGDATGSTGTVTVDGSGSTWTNSGALYVGYSGTGTLDIRNGGSVSNANGYIGYDSGSTGTVTVDGSGSTWTNSGSNFYVGVNGKGTLDIRNGGSVSSLTSYIGYNGGSTGTVTVDGSGSKWTSSGGLYVGYSGTGTLDIRNGGSVSSAYSYIGSFDSSTGTVTVDGPGSKWTNSGGLAVGAFGKGTLNITGGGLVSAANVLTGTNGGVGTIRLAAGTLDAPTVSIANKATLSGAGTVTGSVTVANGGTLAGASGGTMTINGNLTLQSGSHLDVTLGAPPVTLAGSQLFKVNGVLTSNGSTVDVSDAGSFGAGLYRLIDYSAGSLAAGSSFNAGATPNSSFTYTIATGDVGYIDLLVGSTGGGGSNPPPTADPFTFWRNGSGVWSTGNANWSNVNNSASGVYDPTALLIFNSPGGAVTVDAGGGTLPLGDGLALTTLSTSLRVGDGTAQGAGYTATIASAISGGGTVVKNDLGTLILSGNNHYTGATTVSAGTLQVNGSIASSSLTTVQSGATLSGSGSVGAVTVANGGTLAGAAGSTLTTGNLTLNSGSNLNVKLAAPSSSELFNVNGNLTLAGTLNVSAAGGFGDGLYRLISYTGTLTDNGLTIGATPTGYTASQLAVQTSEARRVNLIVGATGPHSYWTGGSGVWSASGANWRTLDGSGSGAYDVQSQLFFTGPGGTVTVNGGGSPLPIGPGLQFASDGYSIQGDGLALTAPSTVIRVGDGSAAGAAYSATIASALSGNGALVKNDLGTLRLSGNNSYSGGTTISAGALIGSATSFGNGAISNNAALIIDQATNARLANAISGSGALNKQGAGDLELTGSSTLSGATTVEAGRLAVNGSLARSAVTVNSGAVLGGNGTVGHLIVRAGATLAPGNSIGTLNVAGNVSFEAGSFYAVEVDDAGHSDLTHASGAATLNGGTVNALASAGNYAASTRYTILTADAGVGGAFAGVTSNFAFLAPTLTYDANNVYLTLDRNTTDFAAIGATRNQRATGQGIESLAGGALKNAVVLLDAPAARAAFDRLSGEIHASTRSALIDEDRFLRVATNDRLRDALDGVSSANMQVVHGGDGDANPGERGAIWARAFGAWGQFWDGKRNAADLDRSTSGLFIGADAPLASQVRVGALAGYSRTRVDVDDRHSSSDSDNYHLGLYAGAKWDSLALRSGVAYTWHRIDSSRNVALPGYTDRLKGSTDANSAQAYAQGDCIYSS